MNLKIMMRKDAIDELLEEAKENFLLISSYKKIPRPKVKTIMEHLRSCLEYAAQDINSKLSIPKSRFYFPYGDTPESLDAAIQKNLPLLKVEKREIFDAILKLHNFESGGQWLKNLCDLTNHAKHKDAIEIKSDQEKVRAVMVAAGGSNFGRICGESSNITVTNCFVKGKKIDDFVVDKGTVKITKKGELPIDVKITKDRKILVGDQQLDLLLFLKTSIYKIESFINNLYKII